MKRFFISLFSMVSLIILCSSSIISFKVQVPAPVGIPQHIQSLAIIDRTVPEKQLVNIIEGALTGEGINQDKQAAQIAIDGLYSVLQNTQRFVAVRTTETLKGTSLGAKFPDPLPWDTIESLCKKYKVDAIVSLESFDSNFIVTNGSKSGQEKNSQGETINVSRFFARGTASVDLGFRIYDPSDKSIVDEYHFSHNRDWNGSGNSINDAIQTLTNRGEAVKQVSYNSGVMYGRRITPAWYTVSRTYYRKCKRDPDLAEGARLMEVNDWNNAIQALEKAVNNGKTKTRGRAAHNLAVVYEILGNLDQAKSWAQSAYAKYGNKISKDYLYDLNRRMQDQEVLDNQMGK